MVGFEWWSNEVGIIVVGMIGKKELAVYTIALNVTAFLFMVCLHCTVCTDPLVDIPCFCFVPHKQNKTPIPSSLGVTSAAECIVH